MLSSDAGAEMRHHGGNLRLGTRNRVLVFAFVLGMGGVALTLSAACHTSGDGGGDEGGATGPAAVFVIDSTHTLLSFDAQGNSLAHVLLPTPIGTINGGGIAEVSGNLFVTIGQPTNSVVSFTTALAPNALSAGAFPGLSVPRGIAYNTLHSLFFVGNGARSVSVYDASGAPVRDDLFPEHYGPSGVSYDPDNGFVWVANYVGTPQSGTPKYGVEDYEFNGAAADLFDYATQFVGPASTAPYSIAVCSQSATGGSTVVVVGFIDDGSGHGVPAVQAYSRNGAALGSPYSQSLGAPYALSCDPQGSLYIADKAGLFRGTVTAGGLSAVNPVTSGFAGLTPPIYGVFAGAEPDNGAPDAAGSNEAASHDAGVEEDADSSSCYATPQGNPGDWGAGFTDASTWFLSKVNGSDGGTVCCLYNANWANCGDPQTDASAEGETVCASSDGTEFVRYTTFPPWNYGANPPAMKSGLGIEMAYGKSVDPNTYLDTTECACIGGGHPPNCPCPSPGCDDIDR